MIYQFNRAQNNILLHICKHLLYPRYLPFKGAGAEYTSSNATNFLKIHVNLHILKKQNPLLKRGGEAFKRIFCIRVSDERLYRRSLL